MLKKNLHEPQEYTDFDTALNVEEREGLISFSKWTDDVHEERRARRFSFYKLILFLHDLLLINFAFGISAFFAGLGFYLQGDGPQAWLLLMCSLFFVSFFHSYGLYDAHNLFLPRTHLVRFAKSFCWGTLTLLILGVLNSRYHEIAGGLPILRITFFAGLGVMLLSRFISSHLINFLKAWGLSFVGMVMIGVLGLGDASVWFADRLVVASGIAGAFVAAFAGRMVLVEVLFRKVMARHFRRQMIVVGSNGAAKDIANYLIDSNAPYWVNGFVGRREAEGSVIPISKHRLGDLKDLPRQVERKRIDEIIVTEAGMDRWTLISLLDYCTSRGITVWFSPKLLPIIDVKLHISNFCGLPMIRMCAYHNKVIFNKIKHAVDALIALPIFLASLPVFGAVALLVKLSSPGPVFHRAKAIGKGGRVFDMYKFRSMRVGGDSQIHKEYVTKLIKGEIREAGDGNEGTFKVTEDPRVTPVGKYLRKLSLDELPQLLNVLRGEMSLVGPRPCLPYEFELYEDWHKKRASVRPGITGLWQVAGRSAVTFDDMVLLDLYYVYNRSLLMDMNILFETIFAVLGKRGAY